MSAKNKKESGFEAQMHKLETLIEKLEGESLSLDDSLNTFEEAMKLAKSCGLQLKAAREKVSVLMEGREEAFEQDEE